MSGGETRPARARRGVVLMLLWLGSFALPLHAHINSPHIYIEQEVGGYPVVAIVHMPSAIPGEAELQLRLLDLRRDEDVRVRVRDVPPQGEAQAPEWKEADRSDVDRSFFTAPVPLMRFGVWTVKVEIAGDRARGTIDIPVPAKRPNPGAMDPGLAIVLTVLVGILLYTAWRTLIVLMRDATRPEEVEPTPADRRRAVRVAALGVTIVVGWLAFIGALWFLSHQGVAARGVPPLRAAIALPEGDLVAGRAKRIGIEVQNRHGERIRELIPDHGKLMHATMLRMPGAEFMEHVHPREVEPGVFVFRFTPPDPGTYRLLADVLEPSGEAHTLDVSLDAGPGLRQAALEGPGPDDARARAAAIPEALVGAVTSDVGDGLVLRWLDPDPVLLESGEFYRLAFRLEHEDGRPVDALEPVLDTRGHLLVMAHDGDVWAHLYPSGSLGRLIPVPGQIGRGNGDAMVAFPYGFPERGTYRCWVQVRYGGKVRTGTFDVEVR